ncbi:hypothetical protein [Psychrobacter immobilis]|uniref:hypothetical protein n=1 Tax=Psychrobacter immobilis TaxID=498 RepID=UPI001918C841|nr:hypothetical protein [Psychrobacter immobilis]
MKFGVFTGFVASVLFISGCTTDPMSHRSVQMAQPTWQEAGVSQNDVNSALQKCRYDIGMANVNSEKENTLLTACLESKGYRYTNARVN